MWVSPESELLVESGRAVMGGMPEMGEMAAVRVEVLTATGTGGLVSGESGIVPPPSR